IGASLRVGARRSRRVPRVPAVAGRPATGPRGGPLQRARPADRPVSGSRRFGRSRRLRCVVLPAVLRTAGERRRAARRIQLARTGLGTAALRTRGAARAWARTLRAGAAREHAPRGRAADRPRDGADAAVLGASGCRRAPRRLRALPAGRTARDRRAGGPPESLPPP